MKGNQPSDPSIATSPFAQGLCVHGGGSPVAMGIKRRQDEYPLADFPVNIDILPRYPGDTISAVVSATDYSKKSRKGYLAAASSERDIANRDAARQAACISGETELVAMLQSLPYPMNERKELMLLELNMLVRLNRCGVRDLCVKSSHSWTRNDPRRIVSTVAAAAVGGSHTAVELMTHLVGVTFPTCSSASAMHHVFDCPGWLRSWCARHSVPCKDVSVLQLTLYDATGRGSNAMYFPLVG